ncbi:hypothetical protein ACJMK2_003062, partial [Sinanodonta woodiana]
MPKIIDLKYGYAEDDDLGEAIRHRDNLIWKMNILTSDLHEQNLRLKYRLADYEINNLSYLPNDQIKDEDLRDALDCRDELISKACEINHKLRCEASNLL